MPRMLKIHDGAKRQRVSPKEANYLLFMADTSVDQPDLNFLAFVWSRTIVINRIELVFTCTTDDIIGDGR